MKKLLKINLEVLRELTTTQTNAAQGGTGSNRPGTVDSRTTSSFASSNGSF